MHEVERISSTLVFGGVPAQVRCFALFLAHEARTVFVEIAACWSQKKEILQQITYGMWWDEINKYRF